MLCMPDAVVILTHVNGVKISECCAGSSVYFTAFNGVPGAFFLEDSPAGFLSCCSCRFF